MLLLPAAIPAYIIAYTYTDFLEYAGPVQSMLRDLSAGSARQITGFPRSVRLAGRCW